MSSSSDVCTLVWPLTRQEERCLRKTRHLDRAGAWIVGWNPRGLSVVVTWFLPPTPYTEAETELERVKQALTSVPTQRGVPHYAALQVLGWIRFGCASGPNGGGVAGPASPVAIPGDVFNDNRVRLMRRRSDIWLELQEGPVLGEVWCCGYRVQPCQLHVIRCGTAHPMSPKPVMFSATALYGPNGVRRLMEGRQPICIPGARSNLEGVLLPDVMLKESTPLIRRRMTREPAEDNNNNNNTNNTTNNSTNNPSTNTAIAAAAIAAAGSLQRAAAGGPHGGGAFCGSFTPTRGGQSKDWWETHSAGSVSVNSAEERHSHNRRVVAAEGGGAGGTAGAGGGGPHAVEMDSFFAVDLNDDSMTLPSMSQFPDFEQAEEEAVAAPGVPPRLDFPTTVDYSEVSAMLLISHAGRAVRDVISDGNGLRDAGTPKKTLATSKERLITAVPAHDDDAAEAEETRRDDTGGKPVPRPSASAGEACSPHALPPAPPSQSPSLVALKTAKANPSPPQSLLLGYMNGMLSFVVGLLALLLRVVTHIGRFSWFFTVCELRLRELVNFLCLLSGRTRSCGLHPVLPHKLDEHSGGLNVCALNYLIRVLVDGVLGLLLSAYLVVGGPPLYAAAQHLSRFFLYEMHMSYMDWFDGYPAGLKVNEDLNVALCFFSKFVLSVWDLVMRWSPAAWYALLSGNWAVLAEMNDFGNATAVLIAGDFRPPSFDYLWIEPSYDLLLLVSVLGASGAASLVADLSGLVSLHLRFLFHAVSLPYRFTKTLLGSLFRQFRGRKYNPLRHRDDAYVFQSDQMLVATFLFTIIAFLFPTLAVYYFYFAIIRVSVWCVQEALVAVAHTVLYIPAFPVLYWVINHNRLRGGVVLSSPMVTMKRTYLSQGGAAGSVGTSQSVPTPNTTKDSVHHKGVDEEERPAASHTVELTVRSVTLSLGYMLSDFAVVMQVLMRPFKPTRVLSLIISGRLGRATNPLGDLVPHLLVSCTDPPATLGVPSAGGKSGSTES